MSPTREKLLTRAESSARRVREYNEHYVGPGAWYKIKRLFKYRVPYAKFVAARLLKLDVTTDATLFFGDTIPVPVGDVDSFSLQCFGLLGSDEYKLTKFLIRNIRENEIFYDIGANYGFYTALGRMLAPRGEVHVFEPLPEIFLHLQQKFGGMSGVSLNNVAVSDLDGTIDLFSSFGAGKSGVSTMLEEVATGDSNPRRRIQVPACTLDTYVLGNTPPTLIKLDVEGAESLVLEGGRRLLEERRPQIVMEVWGGLGSRFSQKAVTLLEAIGYVPYRIDEAGETPVVSSPINFDEISGYDNFLFKKI